MLKDRTTPLGRHPALTFPWNDGRLSARRHILNFLAFARTVGGTEKAAADTLAPLLDKTLDQLPPTEGTTP